jgi:hypothetical protein
MTRDEVFALFRHWASVIWGPNTIANLDIRLSDEEPEGGHHASVSYAGNVWAIHNSLLRYPNDRRYTLRVSDELLEMPPEAVEKVLIHEACHIGYRQHGHDFCACAKEYGGVVTMCQLDNPGYHVQRKEGSRYKTIATFPSEREALAWAREERVRVPGKYRLSY